MLIVTAELALEYCWVLSTNQLGLYLWTLNQSMQNYATWEQTYMNNEESTTSSQSLFNQVTNWRSSCWRDISILHCLGCCYLSFLLALAKTNFIF